MAFRTWAKLLAATLGMGALAGASQLGLAYGLGIVRLTRVLDVTTRDQWTAQLAWVAWVPMLAAVTGALAGATLLRRWAPGSPVPGVGTELALAFAAAIGAGVVVPLTMQPARTAQVAGVNPVVVIAICAGLGALIGVFAAWAALAQAIARWSIATMGAAVWVIALVSVAPSLAPSDPLPAIRLGVFDAGFLSPAVTQRTALATMPALALVIGALLGWAARRRELPIVTVALAGLPGPALLTIAYLVAGPGAGADRYQVVPYWAAMTATGAGVLGSVLAAVLRRGPAPDDDDEQDGSSGPEKPSLPKHARQPELAGAAAGMGTGTGTPPGSPAGGSPADGSPAGGGPSGGSLSDGGPSVGGSAGGGSAGADDQLPRPVDTGVFELPQRSRSVGAPRPGAGSTGPGAGLGGTPPPPVAAKPERSRRHGRRSSVADAFISRTSEFPAARPGDRAGTAGPVAARPDDSTDEFPAARPGGSTAAPAGRHGGGAPWSPAADPHRPDSRPGLYVPEPATRPLPPGVGLAAPEPARHRSPSAPEPFGTPAEPRGAAAPEPFGTPARKPLPEPRGTAAPEPGKSRGTGGRLSRGLRSFGRGKAAEPLTPEPTPISAPLPHPDPVTPPLGVTPAPSSPPGVAADGRRKPRDGRDEDYVDWVSGLGK